MGTYIEINKYTLYINTFQNNHFWNHLGNQRSYRKSDSSSAFLGCQDPFGLSPLVLKFQSCTSDGLGDMDQTSFEILNFWYNQILRTILTTFNSCKNYKSRFLLYIIWHLEKLQVSVFPLHHRTLRNFLITIQFWHFLDLVSSKNKFQKFLFFKIFFKNVGHFFWSWT